MAKARRTTHRSASGKKLYAVRDVRGRFLDIQTYERSRTASLRSKKTKAGRRAKVGGGGGGDDDDDW